jgi:hypothetical protein
MRLSGWISISGVSVGIGVSVAVAVGALVSVGIGVKVLVLVNVKVKVGLDVEVGEAEAVGVCEEGRMGVTVWMEIAEIVLGGAADTGTAAGRKNIELYSG